ncbi:MAG TPA: DUF2269 family protein [Tepidiformaceae bacterium]|nr:DUF2269 family protein [Tepidiformaceae bacterium]
MESYKIQLFLHIASVLAAFGTAFTFPFIQAAGERAGVLQTRFALQLIDRLTRLVVRPGAVLAALFGAGLIFDDVTGYSDDFPGWLMAAITWFVLLVVLGEVGQGRAVKGGLAALEGHADANALPAGYVPIGKRLQVFSGLIALSIVGILFLMVWKPGA